MLFKEIVDRGILEEQWMDDGHPMIIIDNLEPKAQVS